MAERNITIVRIILFALIIILINASPDILSSPFTGDTYAIVRETVALLTFAMTYFALLAFVNWEKSGTISDLGLQDDRDTFTHLIIGVITGAIGVIIVATIAFVFGGELSTGTDVDRLTSVVVLAIPVSVLEELSYRGYLMNRIDSLGGEKVAVVTSSIIFSLSHFSWWTPLGEVPAHLILFFSFNMFLGGVVLGTSYYLTKRRLWVAVGFHYAWNIAAYSLFPVYPIDPVLNPELFQIEWGVTTIIGFLFALSLIWILLQQTKKKE
jgi:membrane protease YdiL (CAAX protease family)